MRNGVTLAAIAMVAVLAACSAPTPTATALPTRTSFTENVYHTTPTPVPSSSQEQSHSYWEKRIDTYLASVDRALADSNLTCREAKTLADNGMDIVHDMSTAGVPSSIIEASSFGPMVRMLDSHYWSECF